jgi:hypothetical protein
VPYNILNKPDCRLFQGFIRGIFCGDAEEKYENQRH